MIPLKLDTLTLPTLWADPNLLINKPFVKLHSQPVVTLGFYYLIMPNRIKDQCIHSGQPYTLVYPNGIVIWVP